ncbi:MAG: thiol peroxidase [Lentisphaeria bacterium]|nr:thiol peroxidase [Lentisphaeria bacterium]
MSSVTFKGTPIQLSGDVPNAGAAPDFKVVATDLSEVSLSDYKGKKVVLNTIPSVDTSVCAIQLKTFAEKVGTMDDVVLLFVSKDLPFALGRFCGAEGVENAVTASDFRYDAIASSWGLAIAEGPLAGLLARSVSVIDAEGNIVYTELVPEIAQEPNYDAALAALN